MKLVHLVESKIVHLVEMYLVHLVENDPVHFQPKVLPDLLKILYTRFSLLSTKRTSLPFSRTRSNLDSEHMFQ